MWQASAGGSRACDMCCSPPGARNRHGRALSSQRCRWRSCGLLLVGRPQDCACRRLSSLLCHCSLLLAGTALGSVGALDCNSPALKALKPFSPNPDVQPQHFLRLAGTALSSVGVLDYDADAGNELGILERGQNEQVTAVHSHDCRLHAAAVRST
jgi:hypothetical protein